MATSLRVLCSASQTVLCGVRNHTFSFSKRHLLSSSYSCTDAWKRSADSPTYGDLSLSEFAVQIHEQLEKTGHVSAVDMNVFTHQFGQLEGDEDEAEFVEDILKRYNACQESFPPCPDTSHALVRGYMSAGMASRLPALISDPVTFGLFPSHYTLNLLMDHFIRTKDYANAVTLAHSSTMQEDFSNPVNTLLSLYACTQFLSSLESVDDISPLPKDESDGEEEWIKVKYIWNPHYDDHFDIKDRRLLLGKTMTMVARAQSVQIPDNIRISLKVIGAGLYHKFDDGLSELNTVLQSSSSSSSNISLQALDYFSDRLQNVESREADEPEVELGLRTIDDEIRKFLPSHEQKEHFISEFEKLKEQLKTGEKIVEDFTLEQSVTEFVKGDIAKYEQSDIEKQSSLFATWRENTERELERQVFEMRKEERMEEMKRQIRALQEEEELLAYFEQEEKVRLKFKEEEEGQQTDPRLTVNKL